MAYGKKNVVKIDPLSYNIGLLGESGIGKEQPVSEPVLTEYGWMEMGSIHKGMRVYSDNGQLYNVEDVFPQGVKDVYKVTFRDGTSTRCGLDHLWTVHTTKQRENMRKYGDYRHKVLTLREIMKNYKSTHSDGKTHYRYSVPINKPIDFQFDEVLEIDPYLLGLLLGDGGLTTSTITFTNPEEDVVEEFIQCIHDIGLEVSVHNREEECTQYNVIDYRYKENEFANSIDFLGLKGMDSRNKFIPAEYLRASIKDRYELLSGIINTDGSIQDKMISIATYSERMCKDIAELARSLGFIASIHEYDRTSPNSTKKYDKEIEYRVNVIGDYSPLHLSKKHREKISKREIEYVKSIKDIEYVGKEESQCIVVNSPGHTYITKDYIVTHNTTIIKEMCEKLTGDDGYLFLECGKEDGGDAITGINYVNCPEWSMDYDEDTNSVGFEDVIDDIIENKTTEYPRLRTVVIDTYDQLIDIAKPEVIRMHNAENPDKQVKSIKAAFGGYMAGEDKATEIVLDKLWELKTVGVHFIIIGHVKQKEQEDVVTGQKYTSLTTNMSMRDFSAIRTKLHFLGVASINREIIQEKTGKKDNKGKEKTRGVISKESRRITFRDDTYSIDSKSRFADIVPEIDFDVDELIKALTDAIKAEASKGSKSIDQLEKEQKEAESKRMEKIAAAEEQKRSEKELNEVLDQIKAYVQANKTNVEKLRPLSEEAKKHGFSNPLKVTDIEVAKNILKLIA